MFTVNEVATQLKVSRSTVYNAIEAGELPHYRIGRVIRISPEQLQRFLEGTKVDDPSSTHVRLADIQHRSAAK